MENGFCCWFFWKCGNTPFQRKVQTFNSKSVTKSSQVSVASVDQRCKLLLSINTELNHCIRRALTIPVGGVENTKSSQNIFWWINRYHTRSNECQYISWRNIPVSVGCKLKIWIISCMKAFHFPSSVINTTLSAKEAMFNVLFRF